MPARLESVRQDGNEERRRDEQRAIDRFARYRVGVAREAPAEHGTICQRALLDDVLAPGTANLLRMEAGGRVVPEDASGIELRVVNA